MGQEDPGLVLTGSQSGSAKRVLGVKVRKVAGNKRDVSVRGPGELRC